MLEYSLKCRSLPIPFTSAQEAGELHSPPIVTAVPQADRRVGTQAEHRTTEFSALRDVPLGCEKTQCRLPSSTRLGPLLPLLNLPIPERLQSRSIE